MKITVSADRLANPRVTLTRLGYHAALNGSFERRLGSGRFPRMHMYVKQHKATYTLDVHLDASQQSYQGTRAHRGEHDSEAVQAECMRIKRVLNDS